MGIRVRPMGEMKSQPDPTERVKCWKCGTWFMMSRTATRGSCPDCGSQVALHRLNMPMMPSGKSKQEVVRLSVAGEELPPRDPKKERTSKNTEGVQSKLSGENDPESGVHPRKPGSELGEAEVRRMFVEADPRREDAVSGRDMLKGITMKTLIVSVGVATLVLLTLIYAIAAS